tara:strand:- start:1407 stop:1886 length:480 start_codon:yes stop_codon:yes gene_type:complete
MKYLFFFSCLLIFNSSFAGNSVSCDFEEVYEDGSTQSGYMLFNDGLLRYEYKDTQLFTIIFNNDYFLIRNDNQNTINKLENDDILNELKLIIKKYPEIDDFYNNNDLKIKITHSKEIDFIKRISINSEKVNLSIYFINCNFKDIPKRLFQPFAFEKIKK